MAEDIFWSKTYPIQKLGRRADEHLRIWSDYCATLRGLEPLKETRGQNHITKLGRNRMGAALPEHRRGLLRQRQSGELSEFGDSCAEAQPAIGSHLGDDVLHPPGFSYQHSRDVMETRVVMLTMLTFWAVLSVTLLLPHGAQGAPATDIVTDAVSHGGDYSTHAASELSDSYTQVHTHSHDQQAKFKIHFLSCLSCIKVIAECWECIVTEVCTIIKCLDSVHHCMGCIGHGSKETTAAARPESDVYYMPLNATLAAQTASIQTRTMRVWQGGHPVVNFTLGVDSLEISLAGGDASGSAPVDPSRSGGLAQVNGQSNGGMLPWCLTDDSGSNPGWFYCYDPPQTPLPPCSSTTLLRPALDCWPPLDC